MEVLGIRQPGARPTVEGSSCGSVSLMAENGSTSRFPAHFRSVTKYNRFSTIIWQLVHHGDKLPDLVVSNGLASTMSVFLQRCQ